MENSRALNSYINIYHQGVQLKSLNGILFNKRLELTYRGKDTLLKLKQAFIKQSLFTKKSFGTQ